MSKILNPCPYCGKELTRYGRADWRCPEHGDVMLELVFIHDAIDATQALSSAATTGKKTATKPNLDKESQ